MRARGRKCVRAGLHDETAGSRKPIAAVLKTHRSRSNALAALLVLALAVFGLLGAAGCSVGQGADASSSTDSVSSSSPESSPSVDSFDWGSVSWGAPLAAAYGDAGEAARAVQPDAVLVSASTVAPVGAEAPTPLWVYLFESLEGQCAIAVTQSGGTYQAGPYGDLALSEDRYAAAEDLSGALDAEEAFRLAEPLIAGRPIETCEAFILAAASDQKERGAMSEQTGRWFFIFNSGHSREGDAAPADAASAGDAPRAFTIAVDAHSGDAFEV